MAVSMTWPQYKRRECTACGFTVRLSPMQAEILLVLLLRYPGPVTIDELVEAVWHGALWSDRDAEPASVVELGLSHLCLLSIRGQRSVMGAPLPPLLRSG